MKSTATAILVGLCLATIARAYDLVGTWLLQPRRGPDAVASRLVFQYQNGFLSGVWIGDMERTVTRINLHGHDVSFSVDFGTEVTTFRGVLHANELQMLANSAGTAAPFPVTFHVASRKDLEQIKAEPTYSFKKRPLPELHDVASNGLALTPPMGVGNFTETNDKAVRELADRMVSNRLWDAGYVYIQIDEGWQGRRDAQGNLHPNKNFPDMKALADYLHSKGLKLGLYSSPGPMACWGYAGSHGHEEQDAKTFAEWGVDYLKYDWCFAGSLYQTQPEMQALYQKMGDALQQSGRPVVFSLCQYGLHDVGAWGRKVGGNLWRTSDDIADNWASMSSNGFDMDGEPINSGPGHWNDPDNLQIGKGGMTTEEYRTQMTLWSMMAAPLFIDLHGNDATVNDMTKWSPELKGILLNKEVIAIDQDRLGVQGQRVAKEGSVEVWTKSLFGNSTAVALFNRGSIGDQGSLRWADLGLRNVQKVRDLWRMIDVNNISEDYEVTIPPHGSVLLRVTVAE